MDEAKRATAEQYAQLAFTSDMDDFTHECDKQLPVLRTDALRRGFSGHSVKAIADERSRLVQRCAFAFIERHLEGYALHGVSVDDEMAKELLDKTIDQQIAHAAFGQQSLRNDPIARQFGEETLAACPVEGHSYAKLRTHIDKIRLTNERAMREQKPKFVIYHLNANAPNSRNYVNSSDQSTNTLNDHSTHTITVSNTELFSKLRDTIQQNVSDERQRAELLTLADEMDANQSNETFATSYYRFMAIAADHLTLLMPFVPALSEMLRHWVR